MHITTKFHLISPDCPRSSIALCGLKHRSFHFWQELQPTDYLADLSRLDKLENQLSAPKKMNESSTPQPDEPLQINMPTPTVAPNIPGAQTVAPPPGAAAGPQGGVPGSAGAGASSGAGISAPQPQFGYNEINHMSLGSLAHHISINEQVCVCLSVCLSGCGCRWGGVIRDAVKEHKSHEGLR